MSSRRRTALFVAVVAIVVGGAGAYVLVAALGGDSGGDAVADPAAIQAVVAQPHFVFLTSASRTAPFDELAIAPLSNPSRRLVVGLRCDRVAASGSLGVCVRHSTDIGLVYVASIFDAKFHVLRSFKGGGLPSRTRLSPTGKLGAVTSFVVGDSYAAAGQFSTATAIFRTADDHPVVGNLEQMTVLRHGRRFEPVNRNFWGVTFLDDEHFYATMGTGPVTYLVHGDLATDTLTVVHGNVECPALSPDGTRIGFKRRTTDGSWRFTVLDLATGHETPLAEQTSVDDQLAWVDNEHLVYGNAGAVWEVRADGTGAPKLLLQAAASPTIVH